MDERIDVVSDFVYDSLNEQYNCDFRQWRKTNVSQYSYQHTEDKRESVYVVGKGANRPTVEAVERRNLMAASETIGLGLLLFLICDVAVSMLLVYLLHYAGLNIRIDYLNLSYTGSSWLVYSVRILIVLLKFGLTTAVINHFFRLPRRVSTPISAIRLPELVADLGGGAICAAVYCLFDKQNYFEFEQLQQFFTEMDGAALFAYWLFDMLIGAGLAELFFRGTLLPVLRQFGDRFAIWVIAIIGFLLPNSLPDRITELLIGLASGYLLVRSGSFVNCVLLRVVYSLLVHARLMLVYSMYSLSIMKYIFVLLAIGILCVLFYLRQRSSRILLSNLRSYLTLQSKCAAFLETTTTLSWFMLSALLAIVQFFYRS